VLYVEKEGFSELVRAVDLANRYDLLIISNKGQSVTAARKLIDTVCGEYGLRLFVLHDFDLAGFAIFAILGRDTRRYKFENQFKIIDLGLRLADIAGLEREPRAFTKVSEETRREQLANNGATTAEIDILLDERVELNALTSDALIAMIERKLKTHGVKKIIPDDAVLAKAYREFHRSQELRDEFEELAEDFRASRIAVPKNLQQRVRAVLKRHPDLRWDDAIQIVLDKTQLDAVRTKKEKAKRKSGDFTDDADEE
jgi:hypothetical protein